MTYIVKHRDYADGWITVYRGPSQDAALAAWRFAMFDGFAARITTTR